jgi:MFS family permease
MFLTGVGLSQIAPILPLSIQSLGVGDLAQDTLLSGIAFGVTFLVSGAVAPLWGWAADRYGRKPMLLRAAFGMAVFTFAIGWAPNVYVLIILRAALGALAGYGGACNTLIAVQTPHEHVGFALGTLNTARMSGQLIGPTIGGLFEMFWGFRAVFWITGALDLVAFLATLIFCQEHFVKPPRSPRGSTTRQPSFWQAIPQRGLILVLMVSSIILSVALFSKQPILSLFIATLPDAAGSGNETFLAGLIFSAAGLAGIFSGSFLGHLSDKHGPQKVLLICLLFGVVVVAAQAFVTSWIQMLVLNFLMGFVNAGMNPAINSLAAKVTPQEYSGRVFGYLQGMRNFGVAAGSYIGGQTGALFGLRAVFWITAALLLANAVLVYLAINRRLRRRQRPPTP